MLLLDGKGKKDINGEDKGARWVDVDGRFSRVTDSIVNRYFKLMIYQ